LRQKPRLILDVGHNPGAIENALWSVRKIWKPERIIVIFGALQDKDIGGMIAHLKAHAAMGFLVPLPTSRGMSFDEISAWSERSGWNAEPMPSVSKALEAALQRAGHRDVILAIGSHYLAEEVLKNQNIH
jgi:dihydrofolate synthase/folylpolyglutamate synthase